MARTPKNTSIYDKLNKNEQDIIETEKRLKQLKSEREELLKEKDDFEMRKLWADIKLNGLYDEVQKIVSKHSPKNK